MTRPFRVSGLQQVAIGGRNKTSLSNLWADVLGFPKVGDYWSVRKNVDEDILLLGREGCPHAVEVVLMTHLGETKSPKVNVPR